MSIPTYRTIKFRARSIEPSNAGEWVYGFGVRLVKHIDGKRQAWFFSDDRIVLVDFETVGQFTGVWDDEDISDDHPLYEGDIVELEYQGKKHICKIEYCGSGFILHADSLPETYLWLSDIIEFDQNSCWAKGAKKIGNIYEHPHLLKEQSEDIVTRVKRILGRE